MAEEVQNGRDAGPLDLRRRVQTQVRVPDRHWLRRANFLPASDAIFPVAHVVPLLEDKTKRDSWGKISEAPKVEFILPEASDSESTSSVEEDSSADGEEQDIKKINVMELPWLRAPRYRQTHILRDAADAASQEWDTPLCKDVTFTFGYRRGTPGENTQVNTTWCPPCIKKQDMQAKKKYEQAVEEEQAAEEAQRKEQEKGAAEAAERAAAAAQMMKALEKSEEREALAKVANAGKDHRKKKRSEKKKKQAAKKKTQEKEAEAARAAEIDELL